MKIAAIQMRSSAKAADNIAALVNAVAEAAGTGASYIQTPEMTGCVQRDRAQLAAQSGSDADDAVLAAGSGLARKHGIWLHIGSTAIRLESGKMANRGVLFSPAGERHATYDKIHMFDVDLDHGESWRESNSYEPGTKTVVADMDGAKLGMAICYDMRFPQLFRAQAMAGAQMLTAPAAFTRQTGEAHWHVLLRARAIENGAFMVAAAQGGTHDDGRETYGHSLIVNPWGTIIAEKADAEPGIIYADIDLAEVDRMRARIPNLKNAREFSLQQEAGAA